MSITIASPLPAVSSVSRLSSCLVAYFNQFDLAILSLQTSEILTRTFKNFLAMVKSFVGTF